MLIYNWYKVLNLSIILFFLFVFCFVSLSWADDEAEYINEAIEGLITDIPKDVIKAIAWQESEWRQFKEDGSVFITNNDVGLMQVNMDTLKKYNCFSLYKVKTNTFYNLLVGVHILEDKRHWIQELKKRDDWKVIQKKYLLQGSTDLEMAIRAYNGMTNSKKYINRINQLRKEKPWVKRLQRIESKKE